MSNKMHDFVTKNRPPTPTWKKETGLIKTVCCYCHACYKDGPQDKGISHGYCPDCARLVKMYIDNYL